MMADLGDKEDIQPAAGASSVEERCPICLEDYEDKAFVDACFHAFCFECIVKAVEMTSNRCPMCKTSFDTVIHNVRAIDDYDRFKIQPKLTPTPSLIQTNQEELFRVFRGYRTTRLPGQGSRRSDLAASTSHGRSSEQDTISANSQEPPPPPRATSMSRRRKKASMKYGQSRKPAALERRRAVYSVGLRALPIENTDTKRVRVRDISASFFRGNPASTHRLFPWLTREFKVLVGDEHIEFMLQLMQSLIDKIDLESDDFATHLEPFLHDKTQHFMHELVSFAKSPYDMIAYDNKVRYNWPEGHPEGRLQSTEKDGAEISAATSQAGPSGIQEQVLNELLLTRWDDSPPLHSHSGSHSPTTIVVRDSSDSEEDLEPDHTASLRDHVASDTATLSAAQRTDGELLHTQQSSDQMRTDNPSLNKTARQRTEPTSDGTMQSSTSSATPVLLPNDEAVPSISGAAVSEDVSMDASEPVEGCPEVSSSVTVKEREPSILNDEVSSTSGNGDPSELLTTLHSGSASHSQSEVLSHNLASQEQLNAAVGVVCSNDGEDDFEINVYAEDEGNSLDGGGTPLSDILLRGEKGEKARGKSTKVKKSKEHGSKSRKKDSHGHRHHVEDNKSVFHSGSSRREHEKRSAEKERERRHHKRSHQRSRSRSRSRNRSHKSRHHESSSSRYRSRESPHKQRRTSISPSHHACSGNSGDERSEVEKAPRKKHKDRKERDTDTTQVKRKLKKKRHRSRSRNRSDYLHQTDEHCKSPHHKRVHRSRLYSDKSWSESALSSHTTTDKSKRLSSHTSRNGKEREQWERENSGESRMCDESKQLAQELGELDRQIKDNKKDLLKSLLRKERLELLQKNLHGTESGDGSHVVGPPVLGENRPAATVPKSTTDMEKELELLNRAIVDGKRQLLRVMKRVEEEQLDEDD